MKRAYYSDSIDDFLGKDEDSILGQIVTQATFSIESTQRDAWQAQIRLLRTVLPPFRGSGKVYFEFDIPRMGRRIDVVAIIRHVVFVIEFKVGDTRFQSAAIDQVCDYALDLKHFHATSHHEYVVPLLVATAADSGHEISTNTVHGDKLTAPVCVSASGLGQAIEAMLRRCDGEALDATQWERGQYSPTPTIIEAAKALYSGHNVADISRSDAGATNLRDTSAEVSAIIAGSRRLHRKSICFVTGVPGAGKTLVGLDIATQHTSPSHGSHSVFLSGNGPLVAVLREALARDKVHRFKERGRRFSITTARSEVKAFIQNVHHFRDDCLKNNNQPPPEHIAVFDESQRAWNRDRTISFMKLRKKVHDFKQSEPEFLISCLDRHRDWATVVCLVGGGQEINTGEAGISEWVRSICHNFPHWHVHLSQQLTEDEYGAGEILSMLRSRDQVQYHDRLHLSVSMRSFRAETVSSFIKHLLDGDEFAARTVLTKIHDRYPILLTRDLNRAKEWLRQRARGSERYGIVVSSQAERLKPHAIDVKSPVDPVRWFLDGKLDVRSSFFLEDVATEFHVQGLELDWTCVVWDADFRKTDAGWDHFSFRGSRWERINKLERRTYLKNAYRVLLTRARQGMVIVVPKGDNDDHTRRPEFYSSTFEYLRRLGCRALEDVASG